MAEKRTSSPQRQHDAENPRAPPKYLDDGTADDGAVDDAADAEEEEEDAADDNEEKDAGDDAGDDALDGTACQHS